MLLCELESNKSAKIIKILGERGVLKKLSSMGLIVGATVKMAKNDFTGPIILSINNTKVILGRGLSSKIEINIL
ncbi:MAG: ferrous iron transport protein A [Parachlamydiales bacterium]|nr:ferrous iron transport protein A [Parachlamydiales bacterium]